MVLSADEVQLFALLNGGAYTKFGMTAPVE